MIVYLHGFNSSGGGSKVKYLKSLFPDIEIISPSYKSSDFNSIDKLIEDLEPYKNEDLMFIGCSLGAYIAQYLSSYFNAKSILLNPCIDYKKTLSKFLGENKNYKTNETYILTEENIDILSKYTIIDYTNVNITVCLNKDDKLIPYEDSIDFYNTINRPIHIFEKGGHRFDNLKDIKNIIYRNYNMIF